ncbi:MAG: hypothetical protein JXA54_15855, partial [Candidatus Heimdallarchaeota archaeon]|nr:hypothetical protein [Candidatus Heimdallarchaeota archaeon]
YHTLGDLFKMKGNDEAAFDNYKKAVELDPYYEIHVKALRSILEKLDMDFNVEAFLKKLL